MTLTYPFSPSRERSGRKRRRAVHRGKPPTPAALLCVTWSKIPSQCVPDDDTVMAVSMQRGRAGGGSSEGGQDGGCPAHGGDKGGDRRGRHGNGGRKGGSVHAGAGRTTPEPLCRPRRSPNRSSRRSSPAPERRRPQRFAISGAPSQRLSRSGPRATTPPRPPPRRAIQLDARPGLLPPDSAPVNVALRQLPPLDGAIAAAQSFAAPPTSAAAGRARHAHCARLETSETKAGCSSASHLAAAVIAYGVKTQETRA
jgi:hypothetical protein